MLDALAGFDRERAIDAGISPARAADMARVHRTYFGPTRAPKHQQKAREAAARGRFTLDQLVLVEKRVAHVTGAAESMRLRCELLAFPCTYEVLRRRAAKLVPPVDPTPRAAQVRFSRPRDGLQTMTVTATDRDLADLEHHLRQRIDPDEPAAPQMVAPLLELLRGEAGGAVAAAVPRPLLLVPLPHHVRILAGRGDDTVLGLTDGTTMTGADYLSAHFGEDLEVALFHPQEGAVNLYRAQRFANQKQRDLAAAVMPVCASPGCRHGADVCEIHHIRAWKHGGETNINNLVPLCRYHNGANDDDAAQGTATEGTATEGTAGDDCDSVEAATVDAICGCSAGGAEPPGRAVHRNEQKRRRSRRGRIVRRDGVPIWMSPRGFAVRNEHAKYGAMTALFGH